MGPRSAIYSGLKHTFDYSGRATRPEWWYMHVAWFAVSYINNLLNSNNQISRSEGTSEIIEAFIGLITLIPMISVGVRRVHDFGKSGWWYLWINIIVVSIILLLGGVYRLIETSSLAFLPFVVGLGCLGYYFWFFSRPSDEGINRFGPNFYHRSDMKMERIPRRDLGLLDCPNCGATPTTDDSLFCSQCGTGLKQLD